MRVIGELFVVTDMCVLALAILFIVRATEIVTWSYWLVFIPVWLLMLWLLLITQRDQYALVLMPKIPFLFRCAWVLSVTVVTAFVVLLAMQLTSLVHISVVELFVPLWVLCGIVAGVGVLSVAQACCCTRATMPTVTTTSHHDRDFLKRKLESRRVERNE